MHMSRLTPVRQYNGFRQPMQLAISLRNSQMTSVALVVVAVSIR